MQFLGKRFPRVHIMILKILKKNDEVTRYMNECKNFVNDPINYSLYLHGWFYPHLE